MIRRYAVAVFAMLAMGLVVASPAQAGGTAGAVGVKKTAVVNVKNTTAQAYYVLVLPQAIALNPKFGAPNTVGWAKKLGGVLVNPGKTIPYPVPAGAGAVVIFNPGPLPADPNAPLPAAADFPVAYTVAKGKTITKTIAAGPVIN